MPPHENSAPYPVILNGLTPGAADPESVARRLRFMRRQRKLTLNAVAERTGLTKSYLSKIERSLTIPSIASIIKLAAAFDVDVGHLFGEATAASDAVVDRAVSRARYGRRALVPIATARKHRSMATFILRPASRFDQPVSNEHPGEEFFYVLRGEIEIVFADRRVRLRAGDALYFDSHLPHRARSVGRSVAEALVVVTEPR